MVGIITYHQLIRTFLITLLLMGLANISWAETPQERAQKIKEWRKNCNDPDPDLRIAYLEGALATKDQTIKRICIKQTLTNENTDVRNLALRAALASSERLTVEFFMTESYKTAIKKAGGDTARIKKIEKKFRGDLKATELSSGILGLTPKSVEMGKQESSWHILGKNVSAVDEYTINLSIVGDVISGNGQANIGYSVPLTLKLKLNDSGELIGEIKIFNSGLLPAKIRLL